MKKPAQLIIDQSQFPDNVRRDLLESLRTRRVNHKFHYDSYKRAQKWLALHEAYSPARHNRDCQKVYEKSFEAVAKISLAQRIHVIGLGCGGGQKDAKLLQILRKSKKQLRYTPCDVSVPMVLVSRQAASKCVSEKDCVPLVCDLAKAKNLKAQFLNKYPVIITFFGMIPNFEPEVILPKLVSLLRANDLLLFSANLAPGKNYDAGMRKILPQYDNPLTRDWLMTFLTDLGIEAADGELSLEIETMRAMPALKRIVANFRFTKPRQIHLGTESFRFQAREVIRLFFSYRYTAKLAEEVLSAHGIEVLNRWITKSEEEGIFLCRRKPSRA
jgi:L-histidine Nalpha-methyltransferase